MYRFKSGSKTSITSRFCKDVFKPEVLGRSPCGVGQCLRSAEGLSVRTIGIQLGRAMAISSCDTAPLRSADVSRLQRFFLTPSFPRVDKQCISCGFNNPFSFLNFEHQPMKWNRASEAIEPDATTAIEPCMISNCVVSTQCSAKRKDSTK